jgi:hypothetical protein
MRPLAADGKRREENNVDIEVCVCGWDWAALRPIRWAYARQGGAGSESGRKMGAEVQSQYAVDAPVWRRMRLEQPSVSNRDGRVGHEKCGYNDEEEERATRRKDAMDASRKAK